MSLQVMADHRRDDLVEDLVRRLGVGEERVTWDRQEDRWDTGRRAMEAYDPEATWHCVIQDDALPCRDFIAGMQLALDHVPAQSIVQPYVGTRRPLQGYVSDAVERAEAEGASWIVMRALMWGVAIIVPTWCIPAMLPWCDRRAYPNYDKKVGQFFYSKLLWPTFYTHPSLVDHREVPSIVGHGPGRVAHQFIGEDRSALDVDWTGGIVYMQGMGSLNRRRSAMGEKSVREQVAAMKAATISV